MVGQIQSKEIPPVLNRIAGQERVVRILAGAVRAPVHAYLFVGPPGTGKRDAAKAFSAALLCTSGGCGECASCHDVLQSRHVDVTVVERDGASISVEAARDVVRHAQRSPMIGTRQVIVLTDFHLVDKAAPALLKTIEEPPESTVFIVIADALPPSLVTIASRCVEVPFSVLTPAVIEQILIEEGHDLETAKFAAVSSAGRLDRARLVARDSGFMQRKSLWAGVIDQLDGTGSTIARLADELMASFSGLVEVLASRQEEELSAAEKAAKAQGEKSLPGRKAIEERHAREQRRLRTDELRAGLGMLAQTCRAKLGEAPRPSEIALLQRRSTALDNAGRSLVRNPNEALLLRALLLELDQTS